MQIDSTLTIQLEAADPTSATPTLHCHNPSTNNKAL